MPPYDPVWIVLQFSAWQYQYPSGLSRKAVDQDDERPALVAEPVAQRVKPCDCALVQMHTMRCVEASRAAVYSWWAVEKFAAGLIVEIR
jgi:hypothetical protein